MTNINIDNLPSSAFGKPVLTGRALAKSFSHGQEKVVCLDDVSVELRSGEITVLMGPSGSGKTTLLAILSGLLEPDAGQVFVLGRDLWRMSESEREQLRENHCGFIFQAHNLFPALSARQQLEMVLCLGRDFTPAETKPHVTEMLKMLDLQSRANARPDQMSTGQKQRVAIGRALVKHPTLVFADEPTSALDWERGRQAIALLQRAARELGSAVLIVCHDARINSYADHTWSLHHGKLTVTSNRNVETLELSA